MAHSQLSPHSGYVNRLISPTLPGNIKYCLRFFFSLRGEWHPKTLQIGGGVWLHSESCAVIYLTHSPTRINSGNCRFQPDRQCTHGVSAAAAEQQSGEDLDSGRKVQRNLDRDGRHLPDITACQGQWRGSGSISQNNNGESEET